jgi:hypothetical protein
LDLLGTRQQPMELNLHHIAARCHVSGREFSEGDRVICYLLRGPGGETVRRDLHESEDAGVERPEEIFCRWVVVFKPRDTSGNPEKALKLTAENLFLLLADPASESTEANTPLLQFLALMLERKRVLKQRGVTEDGGKRILEHMPTHQLYEVPDGAMDDGFFLRIRDQLGVLVGEANQAASPAETASQAAGPGEDRS